MSQLKLTSAIFAIQMIVGHNVPLIQVIGNRNIGEHDLTEYLIW